MRTVLLLAMGGPDSIEAVRPFLENLFSDPMIVRMPLAAWLQRPLARYIAKRRAPRVAPRYEAMGGRSPLPAATVAQAEALEKELERRGPGRYRTDVAFRYWGRSARQAIRDAAGSEAVLGLPMYPQYSEPTTGSSFADLRSAAMEAGLQCPVRGIRSFATNPAYLSAVAATVEQALMAVAQERRRRAHLLFSAHGVPERLVRNADPYVREVRASMEGVLSRLSRLPEHTLSFQSRVGPVRWVGPDSVEAVRALGRMGVRDLVVVPISFVCEHVETLHDMDTVLRQTAIAAGIETFHRAAAPGVRPDFISALADLVEAFADRGDPIWPV